MATAKKEPIDDVAKPGKTPADATARPIITGHAMMKDPMVTEEPASAEDTTAPTEDQPKEKEMALPSAKKVIQPISAPAEPEAKSDETPEPADKPAEKAETSETPDTEVTETAVVDAVIEQVGDKKKEEKLSEEEQKRQELIDKLVDEKKYFLPISSRNAKRNSKISLLILGALLPVIIGLGLAADAGLVDLGFKVPFDFIKDKPVAVAPVAPVAQAPATVTTAPVMKGSPDADTAKWMSVTSGHKGFTVKIPDGWAVNNFPQLDSVFSSSITFTAGKLAVVTSSNTQENNTNPPRVEIFQDKANLDNRTVSPTAEKQEFVSGTLKGTRYYEKVPVKAGIDGENAGSEIYTYIFKTKDSNTYVVYEILNYNQYTKARFPTITKSDINQLSLIEKMVKTLQIKQ